MVGASPIRKGLQPPPRIAKPPTVPGSTTLTPWSPDHSPQLKKPSVQVDNNLAANHLIALHRGVFMSFRADIRYILFLYTGFGLLLVAMAARLNSVREIQI
jgi:hypothetical protein